MRNKVALASIAAVVAATASACSSTASTGTSASAPTSSATSGASGAAQTYNLTLALPATIVDFSVPYLAQYEGIFKKYGLNVNILNNAGADTLTDVISGQADIAQYSMASALVAASEGKPTTMVYGTERDPGTALITGPSISSIAQLQSVKNCTIATLSAPSQAYSYAVTYEKKLNLNCHIVASNEPNLQLGGLKSGSYTAVVAVYQTGVLGVSQGDHMLIDPTNKAQRAKYGEPNYLSNAVFGVTSTLQAKKPAIVRYIQAYGDAIKLFDGSSNAQVAAMLKKANSVFAAEPTTELEQQIAALRPYVGSGIVGDMGDGLTGTIDNQPGFIGPKSWQTVLNIYSLYGLTGYSPSAPSNSYAERVDMSYYDAAFGS